MCEHGKLVLDPRAHGTVPWNWTLQPTALIPALGRLERKGFGDSLPGRIAKWRHARLSEESLYLKVRGSVTEENT